MTRSGGRFLLFLLSMMVASLTGCATMDGADGRPMRGTSGPVAWEVVGIRQTRTADQQRIQWSYTLVLKETAGRTIRFSRQERGAEGPRITGSFIEVPLDRQLSANSELRLDYTDSIYFSEPGTTRFGAVPGGPTGMTVFRRYHGKDDAGRAVTVNVRIRLDPSVGSQQ